MTLLNKKTLQATQKLSQWRP